MTGDGRDVRHKELAIVIVVVAVTCWLSYREGEERGVPVNIPATLSSTATPQGSLSPHAFDLPDPDQQAVMLRVISAPGHPLEVEVDLADELRVESFWLESEQMAATLPDPGGALVEPNRWRFTQSALSFRWLDEADPPASPPRLKIDDRWVPPSGQPPRPRPIRLEPGIWRAKVVVVSIDAKPGTAQNARRFTLESPPIVLPVE